jgi:Flp pilus assembly protein TadD
LKAKQPQAAVDELRRAVALDADNGWAYYHLGLAYQALGQTAEATLALERALVAAGDDEVRSLARQGLDRLRGKAAAGRTP